VHRPEHGTRLLRRAIEINPEFAPAHECLNGAGVRLSLGKPMKHEGVSKLSVEYPGSVSCHLTRTVCGKLRTEYLDEVEPQARGETGRNEVVGLLIEKCR